MNVINKTIIDTTLEALFSTIVSAPEAINKELIKKNLKPIEVAYPITIYLDRVQNKMTIQKPGDKPLVITPESNDKIEDKANRKKAKKAWAAFNMVVNKADKSEWMSFVVQSKTEFFARFSSGYVYANYAIQNETTTK